MARTGARQWILGTKFLGAQQFEKVPWEGSFQGSASRVYEGFRFGAWVVRTRLMVYHCSRTVTFRNYKEQFWWLFRPSNSWYQGYRLTERILQIQLIYKTYAIWDVYMRHTYKRTCTCVCVYICIDVPINVSTYICMYARMYVCMYMNICLRACRSAAETPGLVIKL